MSILSADIPYTAHVLFCNTSKIVPDQTSHKVYVNSGPHTQHHYVGPRMGSAKKLGNVFSPLVWKRAQFTDFSITTSNVLGINKKSSHALNEFA